MILIYWFPVIFLVFIVMLWHLYFRGRHTGSHGMMVNGDMVGGDYTVGDITVNGRTFSGQNVTIQGNRIIVDGKDVTDQAGVDLRNVLEIKVTGDVQDVSCDKSLNVQGTIRGNVDARGAVNCDAVGGDIKAGGAVNCDDVQGSVMANGSVSCDDVGGSVTAGGSVSRA